MKSKYIVLVALVVPFAVHAKSSLLLDSVTSALSLRTEIKITDSDWVDESNCNQGEEFFECLGAYMDSSNVDNPFAMSDDSLKRIKGETDLLANLLFSTIEASSTDAQELQRMNDVIKNKMSKIYAADSGFGDYLSGTVLLTVAKLLATGEESNSCGLQLSNDSPTDDVTILAESLKLCRYSGYAPIQNGECDGAEKVNIGEFNWVHECAYECFKTEGCMFFEYGQNFEFGRETKRCDWVKHQDPTVYMSSPLSPASRDEYERHSLEVIRCLQNGVQASEVEHKQYCQNAFCPYDLTGGLISNSDSVYYTLSGLDVHTEMHPVEETEAFIKAGKDKLIEVINSDDTQAAYLENKPMLDLFGRLMCENFCQLETMPRNSKVVEECGFPEPGKTYQRCKRANALWTPDARVNDIHLFRHMYDIDGSQTRLEWVAVQQTKSQSSFWKIIRAMTENESTCSSADECLPLITVHERLGGNGLCLGNRIGDFPRDSAPYNYFMIYDYKCFKDLDDCPENKRMVGYKCEPYQEWDFGEIEMNFNAITPQSGSQ